MADISAVWKDNRYPNTDQTTADLNDKYRVQSLVYNVWDVCEIVSVRCVMIEPV